MCGIAGWARAPRGPSPDPVVVAAMTAALTRRGPDEAGAYHDAHVAFGFRRLSIVDPQGGRQPFVHPSAQVVAIFNGELYTHRALRAELDPGPGGWASGSDGEVLVHGYLRWGIEGLLRRLRGMFALAIWDGRARTLHLARDPFGIKPLLWSEGPWGLSFASDLAAIQHGPGGKGPLDDEALHHLLASGYVPAPHTIDAQVRKLEPGCRLEYTAGRVRTLRHWALPRPGSSVACGTATQLAEELGERLEEAVRLREMADVPLGVFLSGGLDSAAIGASLSVGATSQAFTAGFSEAGYSEVPEARRTARALGLELREVAVGAPTAQDLDDLVDAFGEPFADSSALNVMRLSQLAAQHVKVCLSGDGGDEVLAGYATYTASRWAPRYARLPGVVRRWAARATRRLPVGAGKVPWSLKLRRFVERADRSAAVSHLSWRRTVLPDDLSAVLRPEAYRPGFEEGFRARAESFFPRDALDPLDALLRLDLRAYLPEDMLVKVDRASMFHGLEVRVPFLDPTLVAWSLSVPSRFKLRGAQTKTLLRDALRGKVPEDVRRAPKRGFNAPVPHWLRGRLGDVLAERLRAPELWPEAVDPSVGARWLTELRRGGDRAYELWTLLVLSWWWERRGAQ